MKEFTGHASDAVDAYQITSHGQREEISKKTGGLDVNKEATKDLECSNVVEIKLKKKDDVNDLKCSCTRKNVNLKDTQGVGQMKNNLLDGRKYGNVKIKLEIELSD